jgi:hypothetical protein
MIKITRRRKCKHCKKLFYPDPRNRTRQKYCSEPECREASKKASRQRWLRKPVNRDYFRSPENVIRVQQWRSENPGYWTKPPSNKNALQDSLSGNPVKNQSVKQTLNPDALQEILMEQHTVLFGLIAHLTGNALQDHIAVTTRRLKELGRDFLAQNNHFKGGSYGQEVPGISKTCSEDSKNFQLGGSSFGS